MDSEGHNQSVVRHRAGGENATERVELKLPKSFNLVDVGASHHYSSTLFVRFDDHIFLCR